jgi:hypothetical protein
VIFLLIYILIDINKQYKLQLRSKCQGGNENDFTTVKTNKFSRRLKHKWTMIDTHNIFEEFNKPEFQVPETTDQDSLFEEQVPEMDCNTVPQLVTTVTGNKSRSKVRCSEVKVSTYGKTCGKMNDQVVGKEELNKKNSVKEVDAFEMKVSR